MLEWPEALPDFIAERLERGIPSTLGVQFDLWRDRSGWYDTNVATWVYEAQLLRDPWTGSYTVLTRDAMASADSLSELTEIVTHLRVPLPLEAERCDPEARFRLVATAVVRPLTARDLKEVEAWLSGELGSGRGALFGIPRGLFGIVRDLTGLGDRKEKTRSAQFRLRALPSGGIEVTPLEGS